MTWAIATIAASLLLSMASAYLLASYGDKFNKLEMYGIGLQGGGSVMLVGPILSRNDLVVAVSPFDNWSSVLFITGGFLAMLGIIARLEGFSPGNKLTVGPGEGRIGRWRHKRRNEQAKREAEARLRARGKI